MANNTNNVNTVKSPNNCRQYDFPSCFKQFNTCSLRNRGKRSSCATQYDHALITDEYKPISENKSEIDPNLLISSGRDPKRRLIQTYYDPSLISSSSSYQLQPSTSLLQTISETKHDNLGGLIGQRGPQKLLQSFLARSDIHQQGSINRDQNVEFEKLKRSCEEPCQKLNFSVDDFDELASKFPQCQKMCKMSYCISTFQNILNNMQNVNYGEPEIKLYGGEKFIYKVEIDSSRGNEVWFKLDVEVRLPKRSRFPTITTVLDELKNNLDNLLKDLKISYILNRKPSGFSIVNPQDHMSTYPDKMSLLLNVIIDNEFNDDDIINIGTYYKFNRQDPAQNKFFAWILCKLVKDYGFKVSSFSRGEDIKKYLKIQDLIFRMNPEKFLSNDGGRGIDSGFLREQSSEFLKTLSPHLPIIYYDGNIETLSEYLKSHIDLYSDDGRSLAIPLTLLRR